MSQTENDTNGTTIKNKTITESVQCKDYCIHLTKSQVENLVDFFEFQFIDMIRNDEYIDNIDYIADMMQVFMQLRNYEHEIECNCDCDKPYNDDDPAIITLYKDCIANHEGEQHENYLKP